MSKSSSDLYQPKLMLLADKWREFFNPLRGLTLKIIVAWLYDQQLGIVSNITWLYRFIERRDAVVQALIARRTSALEKLDWNIKTIPEKELPKGFTKAQADKHALALQNSYDQIDNVNAAIKATALATFRGFSHLEKHYDTKGNVIHFEPVPQWNWARAGLFGDWYYNKGAFQVFANPQSLDGNLQEIDPDNFIIREVEYPVDEIAVIAFIRKNGSQKDWDGFVATFGIPPIFIELPPDAPFAPGSPEANAYQDQADKIISDARGVLVAGSKVQTVDAGSRGRNPFLEHIRYQDEMIVLAGTGGKLTMLAESGSGTLAGGAHKDTFDAIAEAEAKAISEIFQAQHDKFVLEDQFPGQPALAYFQIEAKELTDTSAIVEDVLKLAQGGYEVDLDQLEEKTGYRLSARVPTLGKAAKAEEGDASIQAVPPTENRSALIRGLRWIANRLGGSGALANRKEVDAATDALFKAALKQLTPAQAALLKPLRDDLILAATGDDAGLFNRLQVIEAKVPELLKAMNADSSTAKIFTRALSANYLNGRIARKAVK